MRGAGTYLTPRQGLMLLLGFSSGLPLALTGSTLSAWLKDAGVSIQSIGLFAAVAIPYSAKFLWAPLVDGLAVPALTRILGRRRSWMLCVQLLLMLAVCFIATLNPATQSGTFAIAAIAIAFLSATQDVVIDAYRVERLMPEELGPGTAVYTLGYRVGMLVSGAGALSLADGLGWHAAYSAMAMLLGVGIACTLCCKEPKPGKTHTPSLAGFQGFIQDSVIAPFVDFMQRKGWWLILLFIATYKLGDAFLGAMTNPFLLEIGFTKTQIAAVVKVYGFAATIIGTFIGGWLCTRFETIKPLLLCGLFHALTNLMFLWQVRVGADPYVLALGISLENLTGGMSSAVLVVFISGLTHRQFTATQYALLSSLAVVGRTTFSAFSGYAVAWLGWEGFFVLAVLLAVPSLLMLKPLRRVISE